MNLLELFKTPYIPINNKEKMNNKKIKFKDTQEIQIYHRLKTRTFGFKL